MFKKYTWCNCIMYEKIFGKYPQVKVVSYVLTNPEKPYTKKEIAYGAQISRVTLNSFIKTLEELEILVKDGTNYKVNLNSKIVKTLIKTQITLAELVMEHDMEHKKDILGDVLSDEEFERFMNNFEYEVDIDGELEKLEENEEILVKTKEYEDLKNTKINTSTLPNNFVINSVYPQDKNRKMINYG